MLGEPVPAPLFVVNEEAVLAIDGWIAVLRAHPYRVDWRTPDGRWITGAPISALTPAWDDREKATYAAWQEAMYHMPSMASNWTGVVEPFSQFAHPIASLDGKLVLLRTPTAVAPGSRYDVINRRGELERVITMDPGKAIVGFGPASVYVALSTGRGIWQLERHPWP